MKGFPVRRWTQEQTLAVAKRAAALAFEGATLGVALGQAQEELIQNPEDHLKPGTLWAYAKHAKPLRAALIAHGVVYPHNSRPQNQKKLTNGHKAVELMPGVFSVVPGLTTLPEPPAAQPGPVTLAEASEEQLLAALVAITTRRITRLVEHSIAERMAAAFDEHPELAPEVLADVPLQRAPELSLRRYLVVGLLPMQVMVVRRQLADLPIALKFWDDSSHDRLKAAAAWADVTIVMTKFVSHDTENIIKATKRHLLRCNGAVTDLQGQIRRNFNEDL